MMRHEGALVDLHTQDYKSLCATVTICHHGWPKMWFLHFDPCDIEK